MPNHEQSRQAKHYSQDYLNKNVLTHNYPFAFRLVQVRFCLSSMDARCAMGVGITFNHKELQCIGLDQSCLVKSSNLTKKQSPVGQKTNTKSVDNRGELKTLYVQKKGLL